jgi:predicted acylesterase/phospholipase RssA
MDRMKKPKRAITLAGGGPAAGLHIGALRFLRDAGAEFDVWALSCIGAWVGLVYQQCDRGKEPEQTYDFFRGIFRDDESYARFPINTVFGPDTNTIAQAMGGFLSNPKSYDKLFLPEQMMKSYADTVSLMFDRSRWTEGDINHWMLNFMAAQPATRFLTSLMYLSEINGLSRIYYPDSSFLNSIKIDRLFEKDKPFIYHNAWNITKSRLEQFSNKYKDGYGDITTQSLCACSALPYIESTVDINGDTYCEGALVDTVNFEGLLEDHPDLDEIWVSRIVDTSQIRRPRNLTEGLGNLCMLFCGAVGDDDIKLFRYKARLESGWEGQIVEIRVDSNINYDWSHSNLDHGVKHGARAAEEAWDKYNAGIFRQQADADLQRFSDYRRTSHSSQSIAAE